MQDCNGLWVKNKEVPFVGLPAAIMNTLLYQILAVKQACAHVHDMSKWQLNHAGILLANKSPYIYRVSHHLSKLNTTSTSAVSRRKTAQSFFFTEKQTITLIFNTTFLKILLLGKYARFCWNNSYLFFLFIYLFFVFFCEILYEGGNRKAHC